MEDDDPAIGVSNLFHINAKAELIEDAALDVGRVEEGLAPDDLARELVGHTEHELAAAFVADGNAVLHELGRVVLVLRLLKLKVLAFAGGVHPALEVGKRGAHGEEGCTPRLSIAIWPHKPYASPRLRGKVLRPRPSSLLHVGLRLRSALQPSPVVEKGRPAPSPSLDKRRDARRRAVVGGACQNLSDEPRARVLLLSGEHLSPVHAGGL